MHYVKETWYHRWIYTAFICMMYGYCAAVIIEHENVFEHGQMTISQWIYHDSVAIVVKIDYEQLWHVEMKTFVNSTSFSIFFSKAQQVDASWAMWIYLVVVFVWPI